jgi:hypothetical protein
MVKGIRDGRKEKIYTSTEADYLTADLKEVGNSNGLMDVTILVTLLMHRCKEKEDLSGLTNMEEKQLLKDNSLQTYSTEKESYPGQMEMYTVVGLTMGSMKEKEYSLGQTPNSNTMVLSEEGRCMGRVPSLILMEFLKEISKLDFWKAKVVQGFTMVIDTLGSSLTQSSMDTVAISMQTVLR